MQEPCLGGMEVGMRNANTKWLDMPKPYFNKRVSVHAETHTQNRSSENGPENNHSSAQC